VSLFAKRAVPTAGELIPSRLSVRRGNVTVNNETALRHSAVWACLRLRANMVSTMPVDLYRTVGGQQVEMPKPAVLVNPGGEKVRMRRVAVLHSVRPWTGRATCSG
jgi:phage portal protein BeeE